jgi:hypothetical protein
LLNEKEDMIAKSILGVLTLSIIAAFGVASPAVAESPSYPWRVQGETYQCWYMTREQWRQWIFAVFAQSILTCRGVREKNRCSFSPEGVSEKCRRELAAAGIEH